MIERNVFLKKVYGYDDVKDELYKILNWYLDDNLEIDKKEYLPHGIIFYGDPGFGKTLLSREFAKSFNYRIFLVNGDSEKLDEDITSTYNQAKKEENGAIVFIDEIDRLIYEDSKLERILQIGLDGFNKEGNVLTIATANNFIALPDSLIRDGRFDRKFKIEISSEKELKVIVRKMLKDHNFLICDNEEEIEELTLHFEHASVSQIKSVCNSVFLRNGKNATLEDFINEIYFIKTGFIRKDKDFKVARQVSIHEAGHALYLYKFSKTMEFLRVICKATSGTTYFSDILESDGKERTIENVQSSIAGIVAEELIFKSHGVGCNQDLDDAYNASFALLNKCNIHNESYYCPKTFSYNSDSISEFEKKIFAKRINRFIKKNKRIVKRLLKRYKKELINLADKIDEKKQLARKDLIEELN